MRKGLAYLLVFFAGCLVAALAVGAIAGGRLLQGVGAASSGGEAVRDLNAPPPAVRPTGDANMVAAAAAKLQPAVVDVHTIGHPVSSGPSGLSEDPFFRRFFGGPGENESAPRSVPRGAGSGVIISKDGYILTNQHVVADAERMTVQVGDRGYDARAVGSDQLSDVAVVKIDPKGRDLPVAELGNSDTVRVGDWAVAIGNPLDIGTTVTLGIISALNRKGLTAEGHPLNSVIQTDAAINPGNSGGALANIQGQVIGINEAIASPTGSYVGIGFAIPINAARKIAAELIEKGKIVRPYLGISMLPLKSVPPDARRQLGISVSGDEGAVVQQVYQGSPAEAAGVQVYDVILEANRQKISDPDALSGMVQKMKVDETLSLLVSRAGQNRIVAVKLRERPATFGQAPSPSRGQP